MHKNVFVPPPPNPLAQSNIVSNCPVATKHSLLKLIAKTTEIDFRYFSDDSSKTTAARAALQGVYGFNSLPPKCWRKFCGRGSALNAVRGAYSAPPYPVAGCPLSAAPPQEPYPCCRALGLSGLACPAS